MKLREEEIKQKGGQIGSREEMMKNEITTLKKENEDFLGLVEDIKGIIKTKKE